MFVRVYTMYSRKYKAKLEYFIAKTLILEEEINQLRKIAKILQDKMEEIHKQLEASVGDSGVKKSP